MTQEEKQLLLKDPCARLPYGVICDMWFEINPEVKITEALKCGGLMRLMNNAFDFMAKPYLRPMSSMTEKEKVAMKSDLFSEFTAEGFDLLNEHHFDYRGLIEKGLALEAPEGMYRL